MNVSPKSWTIAVLATCALATSARGQSRVTPAQEEGSRYEPSREEPPPEPPEPPAPAGKTDTFGQVLSLLNLQAEWSGYGEVTYTKKPDEDDIKVELAPILVARMGDHFAAEVEFDIQPDELSPEYIIVDYTLSQAFTVRMGYFIVPFGYFNEILHPSFRWNMITEPPMMHEVVPTTWVDSGIQVRGKLNLFTGASLGYAAYVIKGLGGDADFRDHKSIINDLEDSRNEVNADKGVGARLVFEYVRGFGAARIGVSSYTNAVDPKGIDRLSMLGMDVQFELGPVLLRAEAVQDFLGTDLDPLIPFERGMYGQLALRLGYFEPALRYDATYERPNAGPAVLEQRLSAALSYSPLEFFRMRIEGDFDLPLQEVPLSRLALMASFSF